MKKFLITKGSTKATGEPRYGLGPSDDPRLDAKQHESNRSSIWDQTFQETDAWLTGLDYGCISKSKCECYDEAWTFWAETVQKQTEKSGKQIILRGSMSLVEYYGLITWGDLPSAPSIIS